MISHVCGRVTALGATWVVLDVGGFGLHLLCTPATAAGARLGEQTTLHTSLVVREDSLTLYGFAQQDEREAFQVVQTASGVGPKLAQAIMSVLNPGELKAAILREDLARLCTVPGIGRKGAQKMVIELKDKVNGLGFGEADLPAPSGGVLWRDQVVDGLQGLGWSARDAEAACDKVSPLAEAEPDISVGALMRAALASLAKR